ncbi:winged helix-turn-helix domain-containing protein [Raoultella terrigena]|uniref:winged helix-turn-helix domain-containing protein n=1 Tax=Raoultella terrigena TaxID=577 RepID=UPI000F923E85|nr:winged helix-turn-helix domain-containing protein [Raoultella terrigena]ROR94393.1 DNA-binding winged helix-turn-helix (wHTH) protein [Raoultella terrigena]
MANGSNELYKLPTDLRVNYIINECVEFQPATSTLRNIHTPDLKVTLNLPAGRCLLLLINHTGSVVSQQDFMDIVWKQNGMRVTANAYYQNISILRRGLIHAGLEENVIITLPRIGLTLASGTQIRQSVTDASPDSGKTKKPIHSTSIAVVKDTSHKEIERASTSIGEYGLKNEPAWSGDGNKSLPPTLISVKRRRPIFTVKNGVLLAAGITAMAALLSYMAGIKESYFSGYETLTSTQRCHVLSAEPASESLKKTMLSKYGEHITRDCRNYPWVYVTTTTDLPRTSIIRCNKPFAQSTSCISEYFIE